ncbi:MAG: hypothetical protein Q9217_003646 [Psora testacea]
MPSSRRIKTIATALAIAACFLLFMSRDTSTQEFYSRTVAALDKKEASDAKAASKLRTIKDTSKNEEPTRVDSTLQKPLAEPASKDKSHTDEEIPLKGDPNDYLVDKPTADKASKEVVSERTTSEKGDDDTRSVAGRKKMKGGESKDLHSGKESPKEGKKEKKKEPLKSKEESEIETEMNSILKRGPIIIFSKSYCPYSAKAKRILMDKYTIVPRPHVVELDQHPLGAGLQDALEKSTGRRTVPNILINGKSIGGGDEIESAENAGTLVEKVKSMGGKRIMEATQRRTGD